MLILCGAGQLDCWDDFTVFKKGNFFLEHLEHVAINRFDGLVTQNLWVNDFMVFLSQWNHTICFLNLGLSSLNFGHENILPLIGDGCDQECPWHHLVGLDGLDMVWTFNVKDLCRLHHLLHALLKVGALPQEALVTRGRHEVVWAFRET
jgi:hypothetical protein